MTTLWPTLLLLLSACGTGLKHSETSVVVEEGPGEPGDGDILGIVVTPDEVIVPVGSVVQLEALGLNTDRQTLDLTDAVDWSSSAPSIASISNALSEEGVLRGMSAGTSVIVADFDGVQSAPSRITVTEADLVRLAISQDAITVAQGDTVQLSVDATFSDGSTSDASSQVRWIIGDGTVAQFDGDGLLEGISLGDTTARVEWNGVSSDPVPVEVVEEVSSASGDLYFDWVSSYIEDGTFEVTVSIRNDSPAPVSAIWVDLFVDKDFVPTYGDWPDWYHMVEYIGPNESTTVTFSASSSADRHDYAVLIDSMQAVTETDEDNNLVEGATDEATGGGGGGSTEPGGRPNLVVSYVGGFSEGGTTEYWVDVTNSGDGVAERFYIDVWHDRDASDEPSLYSDGDAYLLFDEGLPPGEVHFATLTVPLVCSECGAWAMVDSYDMVSESSETDNTFFYSHSD